MTVDVDSAEDIGDRPSVSWAESDRRDNDRRSANRRINASAPRRSLMRVFGAWATGVTSAIFAIIFLFTLLVATETPWIALLAAAFAVVVSNLALMLGLLEQRLIEIRLELLMANGGLRRAERRSGERRIVQDEVAALRGRRSNDNANANDINPS